MEGDLLIVNPRKFKSTQGDPDPTKSTQLAQPLRRSLKRVEDVAASCSADDQARLADQLEKLVEGWRAELKAQLALL